MKELMFHDYSDDSEVSIEGDTQETLNTEIVGVLESQSKEILRLSIKCGEATRVVE